VVRPSHLGGRAGGVVGGGQSRDRRRRRCGDARGRAGDLDIEGVEYLQRHEIEIAGDANAGRARIDDAKVSRSTLSQLLFIRDSLN
jgi:hypothetical protein